MSKERRQIQATFVAMTVDARRRRTKPCVMADGELTLKLDEETRRRLADLADLAGVSVETYVLEIIADDLEHDGLAASRIWLAEYDRTGEYIRVEEAMAHFDRAVEARLSERRGDDRFGCRPLHVGTSIVWSTSLRTRRARAHQGSHRAGMRIDLAR
jgi:hypothetical protein